MVQFVEIKKLLTGLKVKDWNRAVSPGGLVLARDMMSSGPLWLQTESGQGALSHEQSKMGFCRSTMLALMCNFLGFILLPGRAEMSQDDHPLSVSLSHKVSHSQATLECTI